MRARYPDSDGYVARNGVKLFYEVFGEGDQTVLFLPTWSIIHSRQWKMQIPYFARHHRVVTFDGRGNGRSDRPDDPLAYSEKEFARDAIAVMDETDTERAVIVSFSLGAQRGLILAAEHPDRVAGAAFICPSVPLAPTHEYRGMNNFDEVIDSDEGWAKENRHYWLRDYRDYLEWFFSHVFSEPHSTKPIEDCVGWGLDTSAETLLKTIDSPDLEQKEALRERVGIDLFRSHARGSHDQPHASNTRRRKLWKLGHP